MDESDLKPLVMSDLPNRINLPAENCSKKWLPGTWQDGIRKSAFQPYKQTNSCTVLTNLQRGNTEAATPVPQPTDINFHTRAGQGEITEIDIKNEKRIDVCDENGLTALQWASNYGQINTIKLLIDNGADINFVGPDGQSSLLLAASGGHYDAVKCLIQMGADVNISDDFGNTALIYAALGNHPHTCNELLLNKADMTLENINGQTAFDVAVENDSYLAQAVIENILLDLLK